MLQLAVQVTCKNACLLYFIQGSYNVVSPYSKVSPISCNVTLLVKNMQLKLCVNITASMKILQALLKDLHLLCVTFYLNVAVVW